MAIAKTKTKTLILCVDYGTSLLKVLGGKALDDFKAYTVAPHIIKVSREICDSYRYTAQDVDESKNPALSAFVSVGEQYYAVGDFARRVFFATNPVKPLKIENAVPKTLAALWMLSQLYGAESSLSIALCCFLPPGEFQDAAKFEIELAQALANFDTPTGIMKVKLVKFQCWPEGFGLVKRHMNSRGSILQGSTIALVMVGHRNLSTFSYTNNRIEGFRSSDLGFTKLMSLVIEQTSGYESNTLLEPLAKYCISLDESYLLGILKRSGEADRQFELKGLTEAVDLAIERYYYAVTSWLDEMLSLEANEVLLGGGTARVLGKKIVSYLNEKVPEMKDRSGVPAVFSHGALSEDAYPVSIAELDMDVRFADVWCLWRYQLPILLSKK